MKKKITQLEPGSLIKYKLSEIITNKFVFEAPKSQGAVGDIVHYTVNYNINPTIKYNIKDDLILIAMSVTSILVEIEHVALDCETTFVYHAKELKTFLEYDEEKNNWRFIDVRHEPLLTTLIAVSLSTMRGMLFEKCKGTLLESAIIPITNPAIFIKKGQSEPKEKRSKTK
jgi:hypothetical protein